MWRAGLRWFTGTRHPGHTAVAVETTDAAGRTASSTQTVNVTAAAATLSVVPGHVPADGTSSATLTLRLLGANVADQFVTIQARGGSSMVSAPQTIGGRIVGLEQHAFPLTAMTDAKGLAVFYVSDSTPETVDYTVSVSRRGVLLGSIVVFESAADAGKSSITASPSTRLADHVAEALVTVRLHDSQGRSLPGKKVRVSAVVAAGLAAGLPGAEVAKPPVATTNASGTATFTLTDATPQTLLVRAIDITDNTLVAPAKQAGRRQATVVFLPALLPTADDSSVVAASPRAATFGPGVAVTVSLRNRYGGAVPGKSIQLLAAIGHSTSRTRPRRRTSRQRRVRGEGRLAGGDRLPGQRHTDGVLVPEAPGSRRRWRRQRHRLNRCGERRHDAGGRRCARCRARHAA